MGLNDTPAGNRVNIGFFGKRNAGKSSLVNALTNQEVSVVSEVAGTTTDPVSKTMELLPIGPVVITDTPGIDDSGSLGEMRVKRTRRVLASVDIAVLVVSASEGMSDIDMELEKIFKEREIPYVVVYNKSDISDKFANVGNNTIAVSALHNTNIRELKEKIAALYRNSERKIVSDIISEKDVIVLVTPIDDAAPKGRMILPQVQTIRDILDAKAVAVVSRESELVDTLTGLSERPKMVITDSQVFGMVSKIVPDDIPLTSFSILMARYKGFLKTAVYGAAQIKKLKDGDRVLISEGCTHHRQCNDIGTVKLPKWLTEKTGAQISFDTSSGKGFPDDLSKYSLIVHCGGCMLSEREMLYRIREAQEQNVPVTNYGTAIAYVNGILKRSLSVFPDISKLIDE